MSGSVPSAVCWLPDARAGSRDAMGQMLEACRGYLLTVARQEVDPDLKAKGSASDLVQETFLEAQRDFGRFHGTTEEELKAWLKRLLLNNLANFARRYRATGKRCIGREVPLQVGSSGDLRDHLVADAPSPSAQAMEKERAQAVLEALERLPEDYRRVLLLRYHEDRSFEEIAQQMGRTANAVHKLWERAVERLQHQLESPP